jgi:hypothetical protein
VGDVRLLGRTPVHADQMNAELAEDRLGDLPDLGLPDSVLEGGHGLSAPDGAELAALPGRPPVLTLAAGELGEVLTVDDLLTDLPGTGHRRGRVGGRRHLVDGDNADLGPRRSLELVAVLIVVGGDVAIRHSHLTLRDELLRIEPEESDRRCLVLLPIQSPQLAVRNDNRSVDLLEQLAPRDHPPIVLLEVVEQLPVRGRRPQELVVALQVELAVGLKGLVLVELRRRHVQRSLSDLLIGDLDAATSQLLLDQEIRDELLPRLILDHPVLGRRDRPGFRLPLLVEGPVELRELGVRDGRPIDAAQLAAGHGLGTAAAHVHPPLEHHERHESDHRDEHDPLRVLPHCPHDHGADYSSGGAIAVAQTI